MEINNSARKTPVLPEMLFAKVILILEKALTDSEFQDFGELLDAGCGDTLLENVNARLEVLHPELFVDPDKSANVEKEVKFAYTDQYGNSCNGHCRDCETSIDMYDCPNN